MNLYKFRGLQNLEWLADILISERLYCPRYHELNDPFEGTGIERGYIGPPENPGRRFRSNVTIDDLADPEDPVDYRICSLSGSTHDLRMWAHYGGSHRGVAIEIDFSGEERPPHKITYLEGIKVYEHTLNQYPSIGNMLLHKTKHWEYEDEYRILSTDPYYCIAGRIRRVLLGPRALKSTRKLIERLSPPGVVIQETRLNADAAIVSPQCR